MKWSVALFIVLLLAHIALYAFIRKPGALAPAGNVFQGFALLAAAILFTQYAAKAPKEETAVRNQLALAFWVWVISHALLAYSELLLKQPATGSVTDAIWLTGYCLLIRALYLLLCSFVSKSSARIQFLILFVVIIAAVCAILWDVVIDPSATPFIRFLQVIFPVLDFMIAGLAFLVVRASRRAIWMIGGIAGTVIGITDLVFPYFDNLNSPIYRYLDIPLFVGYSLWWLQAMALVAGRKPAIQNAARHDAGVTN